MTRDTGACPTARWVRAASTAALCTSAAWVVHCVGGGVPPAPLMMIAVLFGALLVCALLTGQRMSALRVGVAVILSQAVYHGLFAAVGTSTAGAAQHLGHTTLNTVAAPMMPVDTAQLPMLAGHGLAAVVAFLGVRRGEDSWWALRDAVAIRVLRVLRAVLLCVTTPSPTRPSAEFFGSRLGEAEWVRTHVSRRGPPVPVA